MTVRFSKYHGAGNDFILVDARSAPPPLDTDRIKWMCDRHFGIGADGLMLLHTHPDHAFEMRYFNADGRESTMCGNGGRCMIAFARELGLFGETGSFLASDGLHQGKVLPDGRISLKMKDVEEIKHLPQGYFLDTGSPHLVRFIKGVRELDVASEGKKWRQDPAFAPGGTNVNFAEFIRPGHLFVRTFERGVEAETLSCGTGVTASAISSAFLTGPGPDHFTLDTLGGTLEVSFSREGKNHFREVYLTGPARFVFSGEISL